MPSYYRGRNPRAGAYKSFPKRRSYYRRPASSGFSWSSVAKTAQKAWSVAKTAISLLNVEHKVSDTQLGTIAIPNGTPVTVIPNYIAIGDTQTTRDGNEIKLESIQAKFSLFWNVTMPSSQSGQLVRMIIFKDMQYIPGAALATAADLLEYPLEVHSPLNIISGNAGNRFVVLKDSLYTLSSQRPIINIDKFIKISDHFHYVGPNAADFASPVYFVMFLSDQGTNVPTVNGLLRCRFLDN